MNNSIFVQTEGYPLTAERLQELQTSFSILEAFGFLAGNLTIITGCELVGTTIKKGILFIDGEPIEFREASLTANATVIIIEEKVKKSFKNGTIKEVYTIRYATFGTSVTSWLWSDFKRPFETKQIPDALEKKEDKTTVSDLAKRVVELEKKNAVFQIEGGMVLWNKPANQIPEGWQEVTEWRGRMPVGFQENDLDFGNWGVKNGGGRSKTLSIAELPAHSFKYQKAIKGRGYKTQSDDNPFGAYQDADTNTIGGGKAFSILNPYRVVLFIEYIG